MHFFLSRLMLARCGECGEQIYVPHSCGHLLTFILSAQRLWMKNWAGWLVK